MSIIGLTSLTSLLSQSNSILIDFGSIISTPPWNNIQDPNTGTIQLADRQGNITDVTLTVIDSFNYINTNGTPSPHPDLNIPATASGDSFYGNRVEFADDTQPTGGIRLSNLDPALTYTIQIFSSRLASDNRETLYTISGLDVQQHSLNAANNTSSAVETTLQPTPEGNIDLIATTGPNNTNPNGFYYLGALRVEFDDPDFEENLSILSPIGGEYWQVGKVVNLLFTNSVADPSLLEYSIDNGQQWIEIGDLAPATTSYQWIVPTTTSDQCLIRVTSPGLQDSSDSVFTITPDTDSCPIVVIGSSTAEGIGATVQDSAWVYRYEGEVYQRDTRYPVINLGRGGYTTYHLLPTGSTAGSSVGISIDTTKNITKALSYQPSSIIINLPSNDAANFYGVTDQMDNFREMTRAADDEGVSAWVCTTQPRNFGNPEQIALQIEGRDSIFDYYGDRALDFWNGIADDNGTILPIYNSGDGVHLNDSGHRLLFDRVNAVNIPSQTPCQTVGTSTDDISNDQNELGLFTLSPNPTDHDLYINLTQAIDGHVTVTLTNLDGKTRETTSQSISKTVGDSIRVKEAHLASMDSTLIYVTLTVKTRDAKVYSSTQPLFYSQ